MKRRFWTSDGFWFWLSGSEQQQSSRLRAAGRCNSQCNTTVQQRVQHKSGKQCNTVEQPVDGQVSGPQVFRKSDHLSPCCPRPTPTDQRRVRKLQFSNSFTWSSVNISWAWFRFGKNHIVVFWRWSTFCLLEFCLINKVNRFDFLICYLIDKVKMVKNLANYICGSPTHCCWKWVGCLMPFQQQWVEEPDYFTLLIYIL